jgi:indole-3-glycerol phosphate synthase
MANPTILEQILANKVVEVAAAKASRSLNSLEADLLQADPVRGFARAMRDRISQRQSAVIAEIKKASPSKGLMSICSRPGRPAVCRLYVRIS